MKSLFYLFGIVFILSACTKDERIEPKTGDISGSVSDKTTNEPVAAVQITLSPGGKSIITGSDGVFSFTKLGAGEYKVSVSKENYLSQEKSYIVQEGESTQAHFQIERIPAMVTADRTELDFGADASVNTLSFNIVNKSYEELAWEVEHNCPWIKEVKPKSGTLKFSKTETIVVVIDRDLLDAGNNKTVVVVRSSNGSSQVEVKAVGAERSLPVLNMLDATNVTATTAKLNGVVLNAGVPKYTELGFVYDTLPEPSLERTLRKLTVALSSESKFNYTLGELTLGKSYYVRAYARNINGMVYSSNEISFTTQATPPEVSVQEAEVDVLNGSAVLHGTVIHAGDPGYIEKGFVYGTNMNPTTEDNKVVVNGTTEGSFKTNISALPLEQLFYVRAYAINVAGTVYSSTYTQISTKKVLPEVSVQEATEVNVLNGSAVLHGTIVNAGYPCYIEKGFVYSTDMNPTIKDNKVVVGGTAEGSFKTNISALPLEQQFYIRAYAINIAGTVYSSTHTQISTKKMLPEVTTQEATDSDVAGSTAILHGTIVSAGVPAYTERGFVYGIMQTPTINDRKVVAEGSGRVNSFSYKVTDLPDGIVYVRTYATNSAGTAYGNVITIKPTWFELRTNGYKIAVQQEDIGMGNISDMIEKCKNSRLAAYTDWRLPTKDELTIIYENREVIGGFCMQANNDKSYYWSSSISTSVSMPTLPIHPKTHYHYLYFNNGTWMSTESKTKVYSARCVRTIE